ncbi:MAG: amidohydrolase [Acidobacteriota bacterium]
MKTQQPGEVPEEDARRALDFRHALHRCPEVSSQEKETARLVREFMEPLEPDDSAHGLGGHGAVYSFEGSGPGPAVLVRCELDALPIEEAGDRPYRSRRPGVGHQCGHDGHMAILAAVALGLARRRPRRGRVILCFQPAEETGEGAARLLSDLPARFRPDSAYALHNLPGYPLGTVLVRAGVFNCASLGLIAELRGASSHAAHPEDALSPQAGLARLLTELPEVPARLGLEGALLTVTHAQLGAPSLGITPGDARLMATLRSPRDQDLERLRAACEAALGETASGAGLELRVRSAEPFRAVSNDLRATDRVIAAAEECGLPWRRLEEPLRWSEDFAEMTRAFGGALFGLGSGVNHPPLHSPDYDFEDALLVPGARLLRRLVDGVLAIDVPREPV